MVPAILLTLALTFAFALLYTFYPLLFAVPVKESSGSNGIGAVAGGVSVSLLKALAVIALLVFIMIFVWLHKTSVKK
jgi:hypothetical protein